MDYKKVIMITILTFIFILFYFYFLAMPGSMQDPSSPTRDQTLDPWIGSSES